MAERSKVEGFIEAYRAGFGVLDVVAIADRFSYPFQITSDDGQIAVVTVPSREAWVPQVERLVGAYRAIGVHSVEALELQVIELTSRLAQAAVHWGLADKAGGRIYAFDASYTLVDLGEGMRITAIAHNETARLRATLSGGRSDDCRLPQPASTKSRR